MNSLKQTTSEILIANNQSNSKIELILFGEARNLYKNEYMEGNYKHIDNECLEIFMIADVLINKFQRSLNNINTFKEAKELHNIYIIIDSYFKNRPYLSNDEEEKDIFQMVTTFIKEMENIRISNQNQFNPNIYLGILGQCLENDEFIFITKIYSRKLKNYEHINTRSNKNARVRSNGCLIIK